MNTELAAEAVEFEQSIVASITASGGFDLVQRAEVDPPSREGIGDQLDRLGVWDVDVREGDVQLEAGALACRAAGRFALPYPMAERLCAQLLEEGGAVGVTAGPSARLIHADLDLDWRAVDVEGQIASVVAVHPPVGGKLGRFVSAVDLGPWTGTTDVVPLLLTLQSWTMLGMLQSALELTCGHVRDRHQFGQALADFQSVQFALTDVSVAVQGLEEIGKYTLWAVRHRPDRALTDALALRVASLEAAETAFRSGHQLHGAIGFCDETPISWLSRYSQGLRRLPFGRSETEVQLVNQIDKSGFYTPIIEGT
jgi:Acyl-CoA dehydrogenase, C-terminal domain